MKDFMQIFSLFAALMIVGIPLGETIASVYEGKQNILSRLFGPIERWFYRLCGIDEKFEMSWVEYAKVLLVFNLIGFIALFILQRIQGWLPLNPQKFGPVRWDTALNTAVSFVTNTNWQAYGGESTMSYLTQMLGMTVQNFLSAAVGLAAMAAFIRGFVRSNMKTIGNFWVDLTRATLYILIPLSFVMAILLISQGVVQTLSPYAAVRTLEGKEQVIALGPAASQIAIKQLGTNGGGFFNANSAHPFENPTPFSNFLEIFGLLIISFALPFTFGALLKKRGVGWALWTTMLILFSIGLFSALYFEFQGSPLLQEAGCSAGINMEGKEVRFGIVPSVLFAHSTTVTSCGAVNCMHDSLMPLTGMITIFNMAVGEVIFGGVGVGFIGLAMYAILTMFLAGLMIGRTPELWNKKLEPFDMMLTVIALLSSTVVCLLFSGISVKTNTGLSSITNAGPHGLSQIIYAFASASNNNGSAFGGLNANTVFYNLMTAAAMIVGRFSTIIPALAIAGSLAKKNSVPETSATFQTAGPLFVGLLVSVVIVTGALTFFPALSLGPILEHLLMEIGQVF